MKRSIHRSTAVAAIAAVMGLVSTVEANVFVIDSVPTREVYYGDLNLNTQTGLATLHGRIEQAAEQVCGFNLARLRLEEVMWARQCRDKAIADAVATVHQSQFSQLDGKTLVLSAAR